MRLTSMRFRIWCLQVAVVVAAVLSVWAGSILTPPRPKVIVAGPTVRFGTMPQWTKARHPWPIANVGRAPLRLRLWSTSSATTVRGMVNGRDVFKNGKAITIPPGGTALIVLEWDTHLNSGTVRKYAEIGTNVPGAASITLVAEGTVSPRVSASK